MKYTEQQITLVLRIIEEIGYSGLTDDEKKIADWFDASSEDYLDECRDNYRKD